jgi:predicted CXXCH cytochrome family protein
MEEKSKKKVVHAPVAKGCTSCHSPHGTDRPAMLVADRGDLCFSCHREIAAKANGPNPHPPVKAGRCDGCHDTHASDNPKLVSASRDMCTGCHRDARSWESRPSSRAGSVGRLLLVSRAARRPPHLLAEAKVRVICAQCHETQEDEKRRRAGLTRPWRAAMHGVPRAARLGSGAHRQVERYAVVQCHRAKIESSRTPACTFRSSATATVTWRMESVSSSRRRTNRSAWVPRRNAQARLGGKSHHAPFVYELC